jgi:SAM-dependent methyltransferase
MLTAKMFFDTYKNNFPFRAKVLDIGSQDLNGSLRSACPGNLDYTGVDFVAGKNVDVVLQDPYKLPFDNESVDVIICSSMFEHSQMFWLSFLEIMRILRPHGIFYLSSPSNGLFHRFPVDCWRFYPDAGNALITWAEYNGMSPALLESFIFRRIEGEFNDFVSVMVKDKSQISKYPNRIIRTTNHFDNGICDDVMFINHSELPEDMRIIHSYKRA